VSLDIKKYIYTHKAYIYFKKKYLFNLSSIKNICILIYYTNVTN